MLLFITHPISLANDRPDCGLKTFFFGKYWKNIFGTDCSTRWQQSCALNWQLFTPKRIFLMKSGTPGQWTIWSSTTDCVSYCCTFILWRSRKVLLSFLRLFTKLLLYGEYGLLRTVDARKIWHYTTALFWRKKWKILVWHTEFCFFFPCTHNEATARATFFGWQLYLRLGYCACVCSAEWSILFRRLWHCNTNAETNMHWKGVRAVAGAEMC